MLCPRALMQRWWCSVTLSERDFAAEGPAQGYTVRMAVFLAERVLCYFEERQLYSSHKAAVHASGRGSRKMGPGLLCVQVPTPCPLSFTEVTGPSEEWAPHQILRAAALGQTVSSAILARTFFLFSFTSVYCSLLHPPHLVRKPQKSRCGPCPSRSLRSLFIKLVCAYKSLGTLLNAGQGGICLSAQLPGGAGPGTRRRKDLGQTPSGSRCPWQPCRAGCSEPPRALPHPSLTLLSGHGAGS